MRHMSDKHIKFEALSMWANYIETGSVNMGAEQAVKMGMGDEVLKLNADQAQFVSRLRKMATEELNRA